MPTQTLNEENLAALLKNKIVFVDWWAPWCLPCRLFGPIFEKVADKNPEVVFAKVNAEEYPDLAASFGIRAIPTARGSSSFRRREPCLKKPSTRLRAGSRIWTWKKSGQGSPHTSGCRTDPLSQGALPGTLTSGREAFQRALPKEIGERLSARIRAGKAHGLNVKQEWQSPLQGQMQIEIQCLDH